MHVEVSDSIRFIIEISNSRSNSDCVFNPFQTLDFSCRPDALSFNCFNLQLLQFDKSDASNFDCTRFFLLQVPQSDLILKMITVDVYDSEAIMLIWNQCNFRAQPKDPILAAAGALDGMFK
ncbi:hypothetical protein L1887_17553 [Cichorium endivia]|nr:hypothetical protein L1887_17553 [Cichorium endivia]